MQQMKSYNFVYRAIQFMKIKYVQVENKMMIEVH